MMPEPFQRDFKIGDRVIVNGREWDGLDTPGTIVAAYFRKGKTPTGAWIVKWDDPAAYQTWLVSRGMQQQENLPEGQHAFHEDYLERHLDIDPKDVTQVEAWLNEQFHSR